MKTPFHTVKPILHRQILFIRYFTAILIDLTVLNLFDEYWDNVQIPSFTISLLAAMVLQLSLQITFKIEHRIGAHLLKKGRKGLRIITAWALLFVSKIVILRILEFLFSDEIKFTGAYHGILAFIVVLLCMVAAEAFVRWVTNKLLGTKENQV